MKKYFLLAFIICQNSFALDAVVTVLEAPIFREKSLDSKIVQYARKGDIIRIHPAIDKNEMYEDLSPGEEKFQKIKNKMKYRGELKDSLFAKTYEENISLNDEFIPIIDKSGTPAFVLAKHIFVYFKDEREFSQVIPEIDETDYRLKEPLPPRYPLADNTGYRGQVLLGFSQTYSQSYPYPDDIKAKGYSSPIELFASLLNQPNYDLRDRLFFGPSFRLRRFENNFIFFDKRNSKETYFELGLGPIIQFDAYKGEKNRLNLSFNIHFQPLNFLKITQSGNGKTESRSYRGYGFSSRIGMYYHRKSISENLDLVLGTSLDLEAPLQYQAQDGGTNSNWWKNIGGDSFRPNSFLGITTAVGLQAAY